MQAVGGRAALVAAVAVVVAVGGLLVVVGAGEAGLALAFGVAGLATGAGLAAAGRAPATPGLPVTPAVSPAPDGLALAHRKATTDALTGAYNRAAFFGEMQPWFEASPRDGDAALIYIDLDHFKTINDTYGHAAGDALLRQVAAILHEVCGEGAVVGRLGGDEFAVFISGFEGAEIAEVTASQLCEALKRPCTLAGHGVVPSASVGYAVAPQDGENIEELARAADLAMYAAKEAGRRAYRGFESYMLLESEQRHALELMVRAATEAGHFDLHYQPLLCARSGRLTGFEALIRLRTPEGRHVSPGVFIPVAEEIGLINEVGEWALRAACATAREWPAHLKLAVNLSPLQFRDFAVADTVRKALRETGFPAGRLQLEITEGLLLLRNDDILNQLEMLKELGVDLAMDDFGAGYCSLSYLWKFPFDIIKIDRSFVQALDDHEAAARDILTSVVALAQSLRLAVTIEGVETDTQAAFVGSLACDTLQGYRFSPPLPITEVAAFIAADLAKGVAHPLAAAREKRRGLSAA